MKNTKLINTLLAAPLLLGMTSCLNKAEQIDAEKRSFKLNETQVHALMSKGHSEQASGLTVFYIPETAETPGADINNFSNDELSGKREVVRVIVENSARIQEITTRAKIAGAYLQSPQTQCVNLLTAYIGMQKCKEGAEAMEQGALQITQKQAELDAGFEQLEAKQIELEGQQEVVSGQIDQLEQGLEAARNNPSAGQAEVISGLEEQLTQATAGLQQIEAGLNIQLPAKRKELEGHQAALDKAKVELEGKQQLCASLPGKWQQLAPFHKNLRTCGEKKKVVDAIKKEGEALGAEIYKAVGPQNWMATDPAQTSIKIGKEDIEISLSFGLPTPQSYSTEEGSIKNATYDARLRELKFEIDEKAQDGSYTGSTLKVSLEKTAVDDVHKFTGSIKKIEAGAVSKEGKVSIEFPNL